MRDSHDITDLPRTFIDRREWFGQFEYVGYSIPLTPIYDPRWHKRKAWLRLQEIFDLARNGDFTNCDELLATSGRGVPQGAEGIYNTLLGDMANSQTIQKITEKAEALCAEPLSRDQLSAFTGCEEVLVSVGRLSDAILFLKAYPDFYRHDVSPWFSLSSLLEPRMGEILEDDPVVDPKAFQQRIRRHIDSLASQFGGYSTRVYLGEKYSVVRIAELVVEHCDENNRHCTFCDIMRVDLRRRFEAATGVDCTAFFDSDGRFQSSAARTIAQDFLASSYAKMFIDGERYFLGHRIP